MRADPPALTSPLTSGRVFGREREYVAQALEQDLQPAERSFRERCGALLEDRFQGARVFPTTSCTAALEVCALLLELGDGDEVLVPSYTFVATATAFALRGARLVFVDADPATLGPCVRDVERRMSPRTRAVVTMHYNAAGPGLDELVRLCREREVPLVEDVAHGILGAYRGRPLGSFGALAATSFHHTKSVSCGQGGALIVNDERFLERAQVLLHRGTDVVAYHAKQVEAYRWVDHGSSYALAELPAAYLLGQLEARGSIEAHRRALHALYVQGLADWSRRTGIALVPLPPDGAPGFSTFPLVAPDRATRDSLLAHFGSHGVEATRHYEPLHRSPMGVRFGGEPESCPVATSLGERLLRLPFSNRVTPAEARRVIEVALAACC